MNSVGIIANPAAGKDIRRLVAQGRVVSNQEKTNTIKRIFAGLAASGVEHVLVMPDMSGLTLPAVHDWHKKLNTRFLDMHCTGSQLDTAYAAEEMQKAGVKCIIILGGDGTNRVASKRVHETPMLPVSTGTNNVFPQMIEGTLAGLAAGALATGSIALDKACRRSKKFEILINGKSSDLALVDVAVSRQRFIGARAIWEPEALDSLFLTRAEPASIGLSSIGAQLLPINIDEPHGLYLCFNGQPDDTATTVRAPLAPGLVVDIYVSSWKVIKPGQIYSIPRRAGTVALDGEREVELTKNKDVDIVLVENGPFVVDVFQTLNVLAGSQ